MIRTIRPGLLLTASLVALLTQGCWASNVHPVHWTKMGVSASRGDVGAVRERMKMDPEAGQYVTMGESYSDSLLESAINSRDPATLGAVLESRPVLNTKLPQSGKTPLALARDLRFDEGVRLLKDAGAKK